MVIVNETIWLNLDLNLRLLELDLRLWDNSKWTDLRNNNNRRNKNIGLIAWDRSEVVVELNPHGEMVRKAPSNSKTRQSLVVHIKILLDNDAGLVDLASTGNSDQDCKQKDPKEASNYKSRIS